jgi:hypothetical protein
MAAVGQDRGGSDQFIAMGDECGLLLVMKRDRIIDFTSDAHNGVRVYRTAVTARGAEPTNHQFAGYPYQLGVEEGCSCAEGTAAERRDVQRQRKFSRSMMSLETPSSCG